MRWRGKDGEERRRGEEGGERRGSGEEEAVWAQSRQESEAGSAEPRSPETEGEGGDVTGRKQVIISRATGPVPGRGELRCSFLIYQVLDLKRGPPEPLSCFQWTLPRLGLFSKLPFPKMSHSPFQASFSLPLARETSGPCFIVCSVISGSRRLPLFLGSTYPHLCRALHLAHRCLGGGGTERGGREGGRKYIGPQKKGERDSRGPITGQQAYSHLLSCRLS